MKNELIVSGNIVYITCKGLTPGYVTASYDSLPLIVPHRWRIINDVVVTTRLEDLGYERIIGLCHVVTKKHRSIAISYKNGNPYDCRLDNLIMPHAKTFNHTFVSGALGYLIVNDHTIKLDKEHLPWVEQYHWNVMSKRGKLQVFTYHRNAVDDYSRRELGRYLLSAPNHQTILHQNNDPLDFRRENLIPKGKREV